jgi:hypothetical protein
MAQSSSLPPFLTLDNMIVKPPTTTNSIRNFDPEIVAQDAKSTRIVIHTRFPDLLQKFIAYKQAHGSQYEKALYGSEFTSQDLVARFIEKRPLTFMGPGDNTILRDGTMLDRHAGEEWDRNGTDQQHENKHLTLAEYLSYDEIMLSSLVGVSGPSFFINDGSRGNCARTAEAGTFQDRGIIVGLVGSRFERPDRMDSVHILPYVEKSHQDSAVSEMIQDFFGVAKNADTDFDSEMYKARTRVTADILLLEASVRARSQDKSAWVYVVGLGLGVWQYYHKQREWYIEAFTAAITELSLSNISTVELAYISVPDSVQAPLIAAGHAKGIKVIFSRRNPAEKLSSDNYLLILSYAWDGNAFPGNEYWAGSLSGSGDPAAACMSTVAELHNTLVNPEFIQRVQVL